MENKYTILVINPGSTSTKIGIYKNQTSILEKNFHHNVEELKQYSTVEEQVTYRKDLIVTTLQKEGFNLNDLDLIMARGGLLKPMPSGVYKVNDPMLYDLVNNKRKHASNLSAVIGYEIAKDLGIDAYIADPVVVDELQAVARISGHPNFERTSIFHALNTKAIGRKYAEQIHKSYEDLNLIIVHMGGGITAGAHQYGQVIDVNQGLDGEGPFSPERSGNLPVGDLIRLCFSGDYTQNEILKMSVGQGGVSAFLGTNDMRTVEKMVEDGNAKAKLILDAMIYQVSKLIGAQSVVLKGNVDGILLTGGVAYSQYVTSEIKNQVSFLGDIHVFPGENELEALAFNGYRVLTNVETPKIYPPK